MVAAFFAGKILPSHGWRTLFAIGGLAPLVIALVLSRLLSESPRYLARYPKRWPELTRFFHRAGHEVESATTFVDSVEPTLERPSAGAIFARDFWRDTLALWGAFFSCLLAVYLGFNWIVSMLTGAGLGFGVGSDGLLYFNLGGVLGAVAGGLLIARLGSRLTMLTLCGGAIVAAIVLATMTIQKYSNPLPILAMIAVAGTLINAVQTTMFALAAHVYPSAIRATGVGAAVSFGRVGGILSTYAGAWALEAGGSPGFFALIAVAMAAAFLSLALIGRHLQGTAFA